VDTLLQIGLTNAVVATALALLAAGVTRCCRHPALAHSLWLLVLLKLLTPALLPVPLTWPALPDTRRATVDAVASQSVSPALPHLLELPQAGLPTADGLEPEGGPDAREDRPAAEAIRALDTPHPVATPPWRFPWRSAVVGLWLTGSGLWWAVAGLRIYRFRRLMHCARPAPAALREQARRLAGRLGLARCPAIGFLPLPFAPMAWAFLGRRRLLFPAALWGRLTGQQQDTLLAHELAHLRRRDHWVRHLELLALGLYWWLPVAWWARRRLQEAEEQCCDAWVVWALPGAAPAYAQALLDTVRFLSKARAGLPLGASGVGRVQLLQRRLTMILQGTTPRALSRTGLWAVIGLGALLLPLLPTPAQSQQPVAVPQPPTAKQAGRQPEDAVRAAEVEKARAEVKLARAQLELKQSQVRETEKRVRDAEQRLAQLEGRDRQLSLFLTEVAIADANQVALRLNTSYAPVTVEPLSLRWTLASPSTPAPPAPKPPSPAQRLDDLEKKLTGILQEVQSLRRELGQLKPQAK
jgi:beta-lactamase regulating signal transducer with metallopeptidase domain